MRTEPREFTISISNTGEKGWNGPNIPWGSSLNLVERGVIQKSFEEEFDSLYKQMYDKEEVDKKLSVIDFVIKEFQWVTGNIKMNEHQHIRLGDAIAKLVDIIAELNKESGE